MQINHDILVAHADELTCSASPLGVADDRAARPLDPVDAFKNSSPS